MLALALLLLGAATATAQRLVVMSYNMRYENDGDNKSNNGWKTRAPYLADFVNVESPDILGVQEVHKSMIGALEERLDRYGNYGVDCSKGTMEGGGERTAIFYNKETVQLINSGQFWLSETPNKPGKGWDAVYQRFCTWARFMRISDSKMFYVFNTHFDHKGVEARKQSAKLMVKMVKQIAGNTPYIVMGDFNMNQKGEGYKTLVDSGVFTDCYGHAKYQMATNGTFNNWKVNGKSSNRIDHIFVKPSIEVFSYALKTNFYWSTAKNKEGKDETKIKFASDHYPLVVNLVLP